MKRLSYLSFISFMFFAILSATSAWAGTATLSWDPNTETDLAGYKIYYGTSSGFYSTVIDVPSTTIPNPPEYTVNNLAEGTTYYFAVTAYDTSNNEGGYSNEVSKAFGTSSTSSGGGGGGCGRIKNVSDRSGPNLGQIIMGLALLAFLTSLSKVRFFINQTFVRYLPRTD